MNQTIRNYRLLHSFAHQDDAAATRTKDRKSAARTVWSNIKGALIAIALCACLAVIPVVVRQLAFNPRFVETLDHTVRLLATGMPF